VRKPILLHWLVLTFACLLAVAGLSSANQLCNLGCTLVWCSLARLLSSKAAALPAEPPANDPEAVNVAIRLPAGGRFSRRFRRSDKLQVGQDSVIF
jgi:hypothetical protein